MGYEGHSQQTGAVTLRWGPLDGDIGVVPAGLPARELLVRTRRVHSVDGIDAKESIVARYIPSDTMGVFIYDTSQILTDEEFMRYIVSGEGRYEWYDFR